MARKLNNPKDDKKVSPDDDIVREAKDRFQRCVDWESTARARYLEDIKFNNGDSENGYQWPVEVKKNRDVQQRPVITINKTRQFCLNITNDARQNKASIKCRPVGNTATYEGAQVMEGIIRHIEYQSSASVAYDFAGITQVQGGIGYWRVTTDYASPNSFDQELYIKRIPDPLTVYLDPDIQEFDGSDMNFGFIFIDVPKDKFDTEHPGLKDKIGNSAIGQLTDWLDENHVRMCEYWRRRQVKAKLIAMQDPKTGEVQMIRSDKLPKEILKPLLADPTTKSRDVIDYVVEWFKIAGDHVYERGEWAGTTVPIVRVVGEETVIEGKMDRKGHVRNLKDPARVYNYWTSSAVEHVALQTKIPWIADAKAIQGYETYWSSANTENHSILPYNSVDDQGQAIAPPQRIPPPEMGGAYVQGLQIASEEMRMASGQYQENTAEAGQTISGKAIDARARRGDTATYHYIDNQAIALTYTGRILIEMIPKIYDTPRALMILGEDGQQSSVQLDPAAQQEYQEAQQSNSDKASIIFNPGFAKYSVVADVGPAYATRRQEAFNAFVQIIGANPELVKVAGDLMFKAADFPMANELAERLKRMVPDHLLGKGQSEEVKLLTQQNQQLTGHIQGLLQQYAAERKDQTTEQAIKAYDAQVKSYSAETQRLSALLTAFDPQQVAQMTAQLVLQTMQTNIPAAPSVSPAIPQDLPPNMPAMPSPEDQIMLQSQPPQMPPEFGV